MFYLIYTLETSLWPRAIVADNIEIELERQKTERKVVVASIISVCCAPWVCVVGIRRR